MTAVDVHTSCRNCEGIDPASCINAAPMTAVDLDALDKLRGALALLLEEFHTCGGNGPEDVMDNDDVLDFLTPVVDRIANERAAAELRAAAEVIGRTNSVIAQWQRNRADALDPK